MKTLKEGLWKGNRLSFFSNILNFLFEKIFKKLNVTQKNWINFGFSTTIWKFPMEQSLHTIIKRFCKAFGVFSEILVVFYFSLHFVYISKHQKTILFPFSMFSGTAKDSRGIVEKQNFQIELIFSIDFGAKILIRNWKP